MTGSSESNMSNVVDEINKLEAEYGKNFKIIPPNDQIKGKTMCFLLLIMVFINIYSLQNCKLYYEIKIHQEVTLNSTQID